MNCRTVIWGSVATVGIVLIAAGITLTQIGPGIVEDLVHEKLSLMDETSDGYKYFVSIKSCFEKISYFVQITPPIPVKANFTFFEVTNPDVLSNGGVPDLRGEQAEKILIQFTYKSNSQRGALTCLQSTERRGT